MSVRRIITTLAELAGAASITIGAAAAWPPAGWIVGGSLLITFAVRGAE